MRKNTLAKLLACLETLSPRVELPTDIMERALVPLERMLAVK
jgi:quinolinate synthase